MTAVEFTGKHYDMGNKLKVVEAQVELGPAAPGESARHSALTSKEFVQDASKF